MSPVSASSVPASGLLGAALPLAVREFVRFIRQPQRVIGSLGQPLLFWLFLGSGFTPSFRAPGMEGVSYLEYFYPGVLLMMILFAAVFSTITVIEDRDQGFLQGVLVAPVSRLSIVLGKVFGGASIALAQALVLLLAAPFLGLLPGPLNLLLLLGGMVLTAVGYTALGFAIAWGMRSTAGFHAIMMVFLMPLWLLSGALFPMTGVPAWLHGVMLVNPVAHAMVIIRKPFYMSAGQLFTDAGYLTGLAVVAAWVAAALWVSARRVNARDQGVKPSEAS